MTGVESVETMPVRTGDDVVRVRQLVRTRAKAVRLSLVDQTKLVTAASELARNIVTYGGAGTVRVETITKGGRHAVRATFSDTGPGIPDVELALTDGWTSGTGLGLGLSGARRLVDEFDIDTEVGKGTTVTVVKWTR
ncbi:MAG TPA: ATP-binding protein [Pseudonocardiaceae bacterium]|nr:ATP-binding protein [Pseudonocardiaceae bacterium]